ncbi:non-specific lipid-transfer protein 2P-like [Zingiber officinale]|uniref:non-specific lipid-transfer protein 2P-like n=1 Tax=Zingiber officinale TaxID=94328 RepID=UPI001C4BBF75|nr:non-specific lipid-transfer protein 2P-like [Zingiber officinale]
MKSSVLLMLLVAVLVLLAGAPAAVESATCDVSQLSSCASAILISTPPTSECCSALKSQSSCFCQLMQNPSFAGFISRGREVAATCGVSIPACN